MPWARELWSVSVGAGFHSRKERVSEVWMVSPSLEEDNPVRTSQRFLGIQVDRTI